MVLLIILAPVSFSTSQSRKVEARENIINDITRSDVAGQELRYAIITTSDLAPSFEDLRIWRSKTGLNAEIFILDGPSGILSSHDGRDDAERLFNFVRETYILNNESMEYLLLGGDDDKVPIRYLWANASRWNYDDAYLSDVYFSSPMTVWDMDYDGKYGEREDIESFGVENLKFPLKVGRFPVSSREEADIMVRRVIDYESSPEEGNWTKRGVVSSSLMEAPNIYNDPETPEDEGYDPYKDNGYKAFFNYTYRFLPRSLDLIEFHDYEQYEGGNYSNLTDGLGIDHIPAALDQGCSFFTFAGQSFYDTDADWDPPVAYSLAQYIDPWGLSSGGEAFAEALTYENAENLTNGEKLPVAYISSCDTANFSSPGDTSLENIVRVPGGGAICLIGSTGVSWRGEGTDYSLGNWYLLSRFWQKMMGTGRPGDSLYWLKQDYIDKKWDEYATKEVFLIELYTYNLLGDPALSAWIGDPLEIELQGQKGDHYAGGDTYTARVTDRVGNPLSNVMVAIYMNSTGQSFHSRTGPDGYAEIATRFSSGGGAEITATGRNLVPESLEETVLDQPVDLMVESGTIEISPLPLTEGSPATITAIVKNIGGRDAEDAEVLLMTGSVPEDPEQWPDPLERTSVNITKGSSFEILFELDPSRSWKVLALGIISSSSENNLENNIGSVQVDVNAKPRFLPVGLLELEEDQEGGARFDLSEYVYDPDDDTLIFSIGTGAPAWCTLEENSLSMEPPENWSGTFDITLRVSDGLAFDLTEVGVFISPVNDPPVIMGLKDSYTAFIDSPFSLVLQTFDAEGEEVTLSLESDLERLKLSGRTVRFVPYVEDRGIYEIEINISDSSGGNRTYSFTLNILPSEGKLFFEEPSIHLPRAEVGSSYNHKIKVGGDLASNATYSDETDLFDIDPETGEISFSPDSEDKGEHWITIRVDSGNVTIERTFFLEIEEEEEQGTTLYWILGAAILLLIVLLVIVLAWAGTPPEQYGLEE